MVPSGTATFIDPPLGTDTRSGYSINEMYDELGNRHGVNELYGLKYLNYQWVVNGKNKVNDFLAVLYTNYPSGDAFHGWPQSNVTTKPSISRAYVEGLAKSNPNRPFVDVPVFLAELRDIPHMIKSWGDELMRLYDNVKGIGKVNLARLPADIASKYVEWQFGIRPYMSDVWKMLDVVAQTEKKFGQLKHLKQGSSRRHSTVWAETVRSAPETNYVTGLYQESNTFSSVVETDWATWVSTNWVPLRPEDLPNSDSGLRDLARATALGRNISLATLYEAVPWTWCMNWFSDIGSIMEATRNTIPCSHEGSCVMEKRVARRTSFKWVDRQGNLDVILPDWTIKEIIRTPAPLVVYPEFSLPLFDGNQLSILSGIGSQRLRR